MKSTAAVLLTGLILVLPGPPPGAGREESESRIQARLSTNRGVIVLDLEFERAPLTVANFIGLAEGTIGNGVLPPGRPFYNGTKFHRVVPGHVIQAGRPG